MHMACLSVIRNDGIDLDRTAVDLEICSEDVPSRVCTSHIPFHCSDYSVIPRN